MRHTDLASVVSRLQPWQLAAAVGAAQGAQLLATVWAVLRPRRAELL